MERQLEAGCWSLRDHIDRQGATVTMAKKPSPKDRVDEASRKLMELCHELKVPVIIKYLDHDKTTYGYWSSVHSTLPDNEAAWLLYTSIFQSFEEMAPALEVTVRKRPTPSSPSLSGAQDNLPPPKP
jgi:hypothetical protein